MPSARVNVTLHGTEAAVATPNRVAGTVSIPSVTPIVTTTARFVGDPGPGLILHGLNDNSPTAFNNVQTAVGHTFKLRRSYNGNNWGVNTATVDADIAAGRIPFTSWKLLPFDLTTVPDSAIDTIASYFLSKAPAPIWATIYHEPEDNITDATSAASYRALFRRTVLRVRAAGVTNVAWASPTYQVPFTFGASGRDWRFWHADWNGGTTNTAADFFSGVGANASVIDLDSIDSYIPLINSQNWQSFTTSYTLVKNKMASNGYTPKPLVIGEMGVKTDTITPDNAIGPSRMQDTLEKALVENFVGICWWNTGGNSFLHGPTPASDPGGFREAKLATIMADPRSR